MLAALPAALILATNAAGAQAQQPAPVPALPPTVVVAPAAPPPVVAAPAAPPPAVVVAPTAPVVAPAAPPQVAPSYPVQGVAPAYQLQPAAPVASGAPAPAPVIVQLQPAQPAAPVAYPPPPPGYVYVPVPAVVAPPADATGREQVSAELSRVDARLTELQRERKGIGGPITQMVIGYGSTLIFSAVALSSFGAAEDIQHHRMYRYRSDGRNLDFNDSGVVNHKDELAFRRTAYAFTALASVGLTMGILGTLRLARNVSQRKAIKVERRSLLERRASLRKQLDYGASMGPGQLQFGVQGQF